MKDELYIKTRLFELRNSAVAQSCEISAVHHGKIEVLSWLYNNGEIRTEAELENKIKNCKEEMEAIEFFGDTEQISYKVAKAKYNELLGILDC